MTAWVDLSTILPNDAAVVEQYNDLVNDLDFLVDPPRCRVFRSTNGNPSNATSTPLVFDQALINVGAMWAASPHPSRITIPFDWTWDVGGGIEYAANPTGGRELTIQVTRIATSVVEVISSDNRNARSSGTSQIHLGAKPVELFAGDFLEMLLYQDSGGALNTDANDFSQQMWCFPRCKIAA